MSMGGLLGGAASVGGGILSGLGSSEQSATAQTNALLQGQSSAFQGHLALRSAGYINELLPLELQEQNEQNQRQLGTIRATYGASGIDMAGSPMAVLRQTVQDQAFQSQMTKFAAWTQRQSYYDQAQQDFRNADTYDANAATIGDNSFMSMLGAALGTTSSLLGNSSVRSSFGIK